MHNYIFIKKLDSNAKMPTRAHDNDAGWDLYCIEEVTINGGERKTIKTGISLAMPDNWRGLIWPRSGLAVKNGVDVLAGVIDSGYRGEVKVCLFNSTIPLPLFETAQDVAVSFKAGDKIAQILFEKIDDVLLVETDTLSETDRGEKGFGSSG